MITSAFSDPQLHDAAAALNPHRPGEEVLAHIAWSLITEPGDAVSGALRSVFGTFDSLWRALSTDQIPGIESDVLRQARARWVPRALPVAFRDAVNTAVKRKLSLVLPGDAAWPMRLDDLGLHAPVALWVRGNVTALNECQSAASFVGARAATGYGEHVTRELVGDLAAGGTLIVSGGAYGIDGAAHRAALSVGGRTVAFLAGGADRSYPAGHTRMFDEIADSGAIVSELVCGAAPTKWRFLARNRLIGALGEATVVVEAGARSGSLNTAGHAADLGRPLGAVPGPITSAASAGCHKLLREYDARCITGANDVRELIGLTVTDQEIYLPRDHDRTRLCDALSNRTARTPLELAQRSGLAVDRVESLLGMLALEGLVARQDSGWRQC
jgi:DNA processing protein